MMDKDLQAKVDKLHFLLRSYGRVVDLMIAWYREK